MEKVILLKTQLAESAQFAKSKIFGHNRLAVILMDNFIEIQLSSLMRQKFLLDQKYFTTEKKYSQERRLKILNHYDELLKASTKENVITEDEQKLLSFCHTIRNNLYHKGDEEKLLTRIATIILHQTISKYQPNWKSGRNFTSWTTKTHDPYSSGEKGFQHSRNSDSDWRDFLNRHFKCIDKRTKGASELISEFLCQKIKETREYIEYIRDEFHLFFPETEGWNFNDFLIYYSFYNIKQQEIERIREGNNKIEIKNQINSLFVLYKKSWRHKKEGRLITLDKACKEIARLPIEKAIEKFTTYKDEIKMMHESFKKASGEFDQMVDEAIDRTREAEIGSR